MLHLMILSLYQIIDPFVEVEIIGLPVDCCKEQTRVVDDNGKRRMHTCMHMNTHAVTHTHTQISDTIAYYH